MIDLVVGHQDGKLSFYKGLATPSGTNFELVTHNWGDVDVRDYNTSFFGYSTPCLFKHQGETYLLVGSEQGKLFLFDDISDDATSVFPDISTLLNEWFEPFSNSFGMMSAPAAADIDNDGDIELVVGNFGGGLQLFNSDIEVQHDLTEHNKTTFSIMPNPAKDILHLHCECEKSTIIVTDILGHTITTLSHDNHDTDIDISNLPQGIYMVTLVSSDTVKTRKFIKL